MDMHVMTIEEFNKLSTPQPKEEDGKLAECLRTDCCGCPIFNEEEIPKELAYG